MSHSRLDAFTKIKSYIDNAVSSIPSGINFKGQVASRAALLAIQNPAVGDMYIIANDESAGGEPAFAVYSGSGSVSGWDITDITFEAGDTISSFTYDESNNAIQLTTDHDSFTITLSGFALSADLDTLSENLDSFEGEVAGSFAATNASLAAEVTARSTADTSLASTIASEAAARSTADTSLAGAVSSEAAVRSSADASLASAASDESSYSHDYDSEYALFDV